MERAPITSILDVPSYITITGEPTGKGGWRMEIRASFDDRLLASVDSDDLFDHRGNRFEYDAD